MPDLRTFLPQGWEIIYRLERTIKADKSVKSPTIQRDLEILGLLDEDFTAAMS